MKEHEDSKEEQNIRIKIMQKENNEMKEAHAKEIECIKRENELAVAFAHSQMAEATKCKKEQIENEKNLLLQINDKDEKIDRGNNLVYYG